MQRDQPRDAVLEGLVAGLSKRWRTVAALAAGFVIMTIMIALGWFDGAMDGGIEWAYVAVYLCAVVVAALQVDRLLSR